MVKSLFYSQVSGRRPGDTEPQWRFSGVKTIITVLTSVAGAALIGWGGYVTYGANAGYEALKKVDLQVAILHQRISDGDEKLDAKIDSKLNKMIDIAFDLKEEKETK